MLIGILAIKQVLKCVRCLLQQHNGCLNVRLLTNQYTNILIPNFQPNYSGTCEVLSRDNGVVKFKFSTLFYLQFIMCFLIPFTYCIMAGPVVQKCLCIHQTVEVPSVELPSSSSGESKVDVPTGLKQRWKPFGYSER